MRPACASATSECGTSVPRAHLRVSASCVKRREGLRPFPPYRGRLNCRARRVDAEHREAETFAPGKSARTHAPKLRDAPLSRLGRRSQTRLRKYATPWHAAPEERRQRTAALQGASPPVISQPLIGADALPRPAGAGSRAAPRLLAPMTLWITALRDAARRSATLRALQNPGENAAGDSGYYIKRRGAHGE